MQHARFGWVAVFILATVAAQPAWAEPGSAAPDALDPGALVPAASFTAAARAATYRRTATPDWNQLSAPKPQARPEVGRSSCIPCCDPCVYWTLTLPLWVPGVNAQVAEGDVTVDTGVDLPDIVDDGAEGGSKIQFAFVGQVSARRGRWGVCLDAFHATIDAAADFTIFNGGLAFSATGELSATIARFRVDYLYSRACLPWRFRRCGPAEHRIYVGARAFDLAMTASGIGTPRSLDVADTWVNPIVGLDSRIPFARNWSILLAADIGGLSITSDWSYTIMAGVHWRFANRWALTAAWSMLDLRKEVGSGPGRTVWDIELSGPFMGISYFL